MSRPSACPDTGGAPSDSGRALPGPPRGPRTPFHRTQASRERARPRAGAARRPPAARPARDGVRPGIRRCRDLDGYRQLPSRFGPARSRPARSGRALRPADASVGAAVAAFVLLGNDQAHSTQRRLRRQRPDAGRPRAVRGSPCSGRVVLAAAVCLLRRFTVLTPVQGLLSTVLVGAIVAGGGLVAAKAASISLIQRELLQDVTANGTQVDNGGKPQPGQADPWVNTPRVNVLLIGSDAGADRDGVRTDSPILASIDTHTGDAVLFGIPRNLQHVPFPPGTPMAEQYPDGFYCRTPTTRACSTPSGSTASRATPRQLVLPALQEPGPAGHDRRGPRRSRDCPSTSTSCSTSTGLQGVRQRHRRRRRNVQRPIPVARPRGRLRPAGGRQGVHQARPPAPERLLRPLVRPLALGLLRLRPDGPRSAASSARSPSR